MHNGKLDAFEAFDRNNVFFITTIDQFNEWTLSDCCKNIKDFIKQVSDALSANESLYHNFKIDKNCNHKNVDFIANILTFLSDKLNEFIADCQNQLSFNKLSSDQVRFGDPLFRQFIQRTQRDAKKRFANEKFYITPNETPCVLLQYLFYALGNRNRLDYGTGHEFIFFIAVYIACSIDKVNVRKKAQYIVYYLLRKYNELCESIIKLFRLEPAGSKGVYTLDDYFLLPFVFGFSELKYRSDVPNFCLEDECLKNENEYFIAHYIRKQHEQKCGKFEIKCNFLYSLLKLNDWKKISDGMLVHYDKLVLGSFPVMMQVPFSLLFTFK